MKTFVIAEAGINHDGDLQRAKDLVEAANECGCNAIKFQTYQTDLRVSKDSPIYDTLKKCELSFGQQTKVKEHADKVGIEFFSTPFDTESLDFLVNDICVNKIKLASFDATNTKFLDEVNEHVKIHSTLNVIMSTGMTNAYEIREALRHFPNVPNLTLLHCVSSYPTPSTEVNLEAIRTLKHLVHWQKEVGYSDHTDNILVPAAAVLVGATMIEKHFTLDRDGPGVDNSVSADPKMMKEMIKLINSYEMLLGDGHLKMSEIEKAATVFRRIS